MSSAEFRAFLDLLMYADPWPCGVINEHVIIDLANRVSVEFGFLDWIDAYHRHEGAY